MNFVKRAVFHTTRKLGKSFVLLCLLTVMTTLILTCFSIRTASTTAALNVRQSLQAGFTIDAKAAEGKMTENIVRQILSLNGVKENYNARSNSYAEYQRTDGTPLEVLTEGAFDVEEGFEHAGKLMSGVYSEKDSFFTEQKFELKEGSHITSSDKNTVLVHAYFAKKNNLHVGDTIRLALNDKMVTDYNGNTVDVKIAGIFTNTVLQEGTDNLSHIFYENIVFTDPFTYQQLYRNDNTPAYDYADFNVDDPAELESIIESVKQIKGVNWDVCNFIHHDVEYQNAKNSLESLGNMVEALIWAIVIISLLLLILILALWVRSRVHEAGILLSVGFSKANIYMQNICETMILAVIAFLLSAGISAGIAQNVGNRLLTQASASEYEAVNITENTVQDSEVNLTEIKVEFTAQDFLIVVLAGIFMIIFSVTVSVIPILKMKPKNILSKMS